MNEIPTIAPVTPAAMASERHARAPANQRTPTPGVSLVRIGNAHVPECRNPSTIARPIRRWMFPVVISSRTGERGANRRIAARIGPVIQISAARLSAENAAANTGQGSSVAGQMSCAKAGV